MIEIFRNSLSDFKRSYATYLSFEVIYSFLVSLLFVPFLTYLFNRIVMVIGNGEALINGDVYQMGLSLKGIMGTLIIGFLAVTVLFVEFGVLILIAHKNYFKQTISVSQSFVTASGKWPKLMGFGIFQLFFIMLLIIPFLDISTLPPLLDVNVGILITETLQKPILAIVVYAVLLLIVAYLYVRWIYTLHFIFIENKSITKAMAASWRLTRQGKLQFVLTMVLWNMFIIVAGFLIMTVLSKVTGIVDSKWIGDFVGNYLAMFSSYVAIALSLFIVPMNMIMLTRFYYQTLGRVNVSVADKVTLSKSGFLGKWENTVKRTFKRRKKTVMSVALLGLAVIVLVNGFIQSSIVYLPWDVEVAGHRGDGYSAPENTVSSVKSGIQKGVDAVEIDVTLTKDDVLVLSHDLDLERMAGVPVTIKDATYDEVKDIDIGKLFDESYEGETLATLGEILDIANDANTRVIIDVKAETDEEIYASEITRLVEEHDMEDLASVQSFNPTFLKLMRKENPDIDLGQILFLFAGNLSGLDVDFYTVRETMLTKRFVKQARKQNRRIWVWTVNNTRNIKKVLSYDVDGIITDYPERVQRVGGIQPVTQEDNEKEDSNEEDSHEDS